MSDRKYRQRGYEDEPPKGKREVPAPKAKEPRAPGRPLQDAAGPKTPNLMASHEVCPCARRGHLVSRPRHCSRTCREGGMRLAQSLRRHSGARQRREPGIHNPRPVGMDSGLAASRRPGMTERVLHGTKQGAHA